LDTDGAASGGGLQKEKQFFCERQWFKMDGFLEMVERKWKSIRERCPEEAYSLDKWHGCMAALRGFLKGWGRNVRGEYRRRRDDLIRQIQIIDVEWVGESPLQEERIKQRYQLEEELEKVMEAEELYWKQRGGENGP
jgi:hypothetical protein